MPWRRPYCCNTISTRSADPRLSSRSAGLLVLGLAVGCGKADPAKYQSVDERIMVIIPRGATYYQALDSLESRGVIKSRDWFSLYARVRGLPSNLKSGVYTFDRDESWSSVVSTLKSGRGLEVRFTVTEGMMGFEVAERARSRSEEHTSELQSRLHLVCRHL